MARLFQGKEEFDRDDLTTARTYVLLRDDGAVSVAYLPAPAAGAPSLLTIASATRSWHGSLLPTAEFQDVRLARGDREMTLKLRLHRDAIEILDPNQDEWGGFSGEYLAVALAAED